MTGLAVGRCKLTLPQWPSLERFRDRMRCGYKNRNGGRLQSRAIEPARLGCEVSS